MTVESPNSSEGTPLDDFALSGRQLALYRALGKKDIQLASMYLGALSVLKQTSNPDRLALSAHGLRELLEKLPRILDMPLEAKPPNMKEKIRPLQKSWSQAKKDLECLKNPMDFNLVDKPLRKYLEVSKSFFSWFDENHLTRKQQAAKVVRGLDPQKKLLPAPIEKLHVKAWEQYRDYFVGVSHHNNIVETLDEFMKWVDGMEGYLLDRLVPRTFDDFTNIDKIIGEGETND